MDQSGICTERRYVPLLRHYSATNENRTNENVPSASALWRRRMKLLAASRISVLTVLLICYVSFRKAWPLRHTPIQLQIWLTMAVSLGVLTQDNKQNMQVEYASAIRTAISHSMRSRLIL